MIALYIGLAVIVAFLGRRRKFGFWGYLFASLLLTPAFGLLLVLASVSPKHAAKMAQAQGWTRVTPPRITSPKTITESGHEVPVRVG